MPIVLGARMAAIHPTLKRLQAERDAQDGRPCDTCEAARDGQCYVRAEKQPISTEFVADGVWINQVEIEGVGVALPQHSHRWEHATAITKGSVRIERDDAPSVIVTAPSVVTIPANVKHLFVTLTDAVSLLCIHRITRTGSVEIAEKHETFWT